MPSTFQSIDIDAPVPEVWKHLRDFHDLSWAPDIVTQVDKVGPVPGDQVGAKRILNKAFHETLVEIDHKKHSLRYAIDDGPSPVSRNEVSNYYGVIKLSPIENGTRTHVEWTSSWNSKVDDAVEFCHGIYSALLDQLAKAVAR